MVQYIELLHKSQIKCYAQMENIATLAYDEAPEETFSDFFLIVFYRPNDKI